MKTKRKPPNLIGRKYGRLTVIAPAPTEYYIGKDGIKHGKFRWFCNCDCGTKNKIVTQMSLCDKNGIEKINGTKSCGCLTKESTIKRSTKHNKYDLSNEFGIGYTTNTNKEFYFDKDDFNKINQYTWYENCNGYIYCERKINGKRTNIYMHNIVMNMECGKYLLEVVDHVNGVRYDNRKNNLRLLSAAQNSINQCLPKNNKTGVRGVSHRTKGDIWIVNFMNKELGIKIYKNFKTFEEAVNYRKELEEKYISEYVRK